MIFSSYFALWSPLNNCKKNEQSTHTYINSCSFHHVLRQLSNNKPCVYLQIQQLFNCAFHAFSLFLTFRTQIICFLPILMKICCALFPLSLTLHSQQRNFLKIPPTKQTHHHQNPNHHCQCACTGMLGFLNYRIRKFESRRKRGVGRYFFVTGFGISNNLLFRIFDAVVGHFTININWREEGKIADLNQRNSDNKQSKTRESQGDPQPNTGRKFLTQAKEEEGPDNRGSLNDSHNNSMRVDTKYFTNNGSTGIAFSQQDRRSSIFFGNPFESSSILMKNLSDRCKDSKENSKDFYTLIDKIYFVRKSGDNIRVSSPHGDSELNCPINSIISTIYLTQGLPLESVKQVATGKIIQTSKSEIQLMLKLGCKDQTCGRTVKLTFSRSNINISQIQCDKCGQKGNWKLLDINSKFPIWGDGRKIDNHEWLSFAPLTLRVLGCISCFKYNCLLQNKYHQFQCGCLMCQVCWEGNQQHQCHLCEC